MADGPAADLSAAILAGGASTRMGRDKALVVVGGRRLIVRVASAARAIAATTFLVTDRPAPYSFLGLETLSDRVPGQGAMGGIATALAHARTPYTLVLACDMPFVRVADLRRLIAAARGRDGAVFEDDHGVHPLCAVYATRLARLAARFLRRSGRRAQDFAASIDAARLDPVPAASPGRRPRSPVMNINTPRDLRLARAALVRRKR